MLIGIIGLGFVGNAINQSFLTKNIETIVYDKYKNIGELNQIIKCKMVFLCLPTPFNAIEFDKSTIYEICSYLKDEQYNGLVIIKSTVEPNTCEKLSYKYNLKIIHNPEFLTARTAEYDFHHQKHIVIGYQQLADITLLVEFYRIYYPKAEISTCPSNESEAMKLFVNSFYATKIQIFNEFYSLSKKLKMDFNHITKMMLNNGWISPHHTQIPGPDGQLSYGGSCFPKDTRALLQFMIDHSAPHQVLDACVRENKEMRSPI